jgi:hypothetical protein
MAQWFKVGADGQWSDDTAELKGYLDATLQ